MKKQEKNKTKHGNENEKGTNCIVIRTLKNQNYV
jgi:hypothetical protein